MDGLQAAEAPRLEARFAPTTYNAEARTVELVWSTGSRVKRTDWRTGEDFTEELSMEPAAIDLSRLNSGAPLLDTHSQWSLSGVLGAVERAWVAKGEGRAIVRFSARADVQPILDDVRDGILRNISVGYSVEEWKTERGADGSITRRAVRWTPAEISLVPVPADASAQVRAAGAPSGAEGSSDAPSRGGNHMAKTVDAPAEAPVTTTPEVRAAPAAPISSEAQMTNDQARAAERARIASLEEPLTLARSTGVDEAALSVMRARATAEDWDAQRLQSELFAMMAKRADANRRAADGLAATPAPAPTPVSQFGRSFDDPAVVIDAMATALAARSMPAARATAGDGKWREYASLRPSDMLIELAQVRGERVGPRDRGGLIDRAFHTTSDFPMLLELAGNKMLEAGYALAEPSYRRFFARRPFNDFKAHSFLTAGDFPALEELAEGGEIKAGTMSEKRERITPKTHAKSITVTRQMLVNDDLGAFADFGGMIGRRIADYENALAYAVVNTATGAGPTLAEGNAAVFTTGRGNKSAADTAVTALALGLGFNAIGGATTIDGLKLNLAPRILVCSLIQQFVAAQFATSVTSPSAATNVNVFAGRFDVVADANIPSNRWYLFADPAAAPVYVYGYVGGNEGPVVRQGQPMGRDGVQIDVIHDFAVGAVDFRGGYYNAGAAPA
jgi:hypothetical protein